MAFTGIMNLNPPQFGAGFFGLTNVDLFGPAASGSLLNSQLFRFSNQMVPLQMFATPNFGVPGGFGGDVFMGIQNNPFFSMFNFGGTTGAQGSGFGGLFGSPVMGGQVGGGQVSGPRQRILVDPQTGERFTVTA